MMDDPEEFVMFFPGAESAEDLTEDLLIKQLASDKRDIIWAASVLLQDMGTSKSIDALRRCCLKRVQDAQVTSILALRSIGGDFAAELL